MTGRRAAGVVALAVLAAALAGCLPKPPSGDPLRPIDGAPPAKIDPLRLPGTPGATLAARPADVPHIYMALQPDAAGPLSIVFVIDKDRDNTPDDDPAIRLTPANGKCNPQELRRYDFPAESAAAPVFGPSQAAKGVSARDLPSFLAIEVTAEMLRRGMIAEPEESRPQNVCTRKLWERLGINERLRDG